MYFSRLCGQFAVKKQHEKSEPSDRFGWVQKEKHVSGQLHLVRTRQQEFNLHVYEEGHCNQSTQLSHLIMLQMSSV